MIRIANVPIHEYSFQEVVDKIVSKIEGYAQDPGYVVTPNSDHVLQLQKDKEFQEIYENAFLSVPDGVPLVWASKFLGKPLKERVNGTDLFEALCKVASEKNFKVFLLGGRESAAEAVSKVLKERHPTIDICGYYCPPFGFEKNEEELKKINDLILSSKPDILFVGLGAPKQEKWIYNNYMKLNVPVSLGIGVSFELVSGVVQRAPLWMQKSGLEWFYRLFKEPKRLWKRYIVGNPKFIYLMLREKFR